MKPSENLRSIKDDLDTVLTKRNEGTPDWPRTEARVDTAYQRALDRAGGGQLPSGGIRGGSSNPGDAADRREADRVRRQAEKDAWDIGTIVARMVKDAATLRQITDRQAETVHEGKLPQDVLPGCRSCSRKEMDGELTIGGHFAGITDKSVGSGLCESCWQFKLATDGLPPIKWCHLVHTTGKKSANRWLASQYPKLLESVQRKAKGGPKTNLTADDLELRVEDLIIS